MIKTITVELSIDRLEENNPNMEMTYLDFDLHALDCVFVYNESTR
jgi:hypothetical protein